jgi:uncharacterized protein YciI
MTRTRRIALALALALVATPALAQTQAPGPTLYICIYRAGPAWQAGKPMSEQGLGPHATYIKQLLDQGRLMAGGRLLDTDGGLAIVRVGSLAEAQAIFAADPAITSGIFVGEVRGWQPRFDDGKPLRP